MALVMCVKLHPSLLPLGVQKLVFEALGLHGHNS